MTERYRVGCDSFRLLPAGRGARGRLFGAARAATFDAFVCVVLGAASAATGQTFEAPASLTVAPDPLVNNSTVDPMTVPEIPTGLTAVAAGKRRIDLSWTPPANDGGSPVTGYRIEQSRDGGVSFSVLVATTESATSFSQPGLPSGATRHYLVRALNAIGESIPGNVAEATTDANSAPVFSPSSVELQVAENTARGVDIGSPVQATDADEEDTLYHFLGSTNDDPSVVNSFTIDGAPGQIRTRATLDYESQTSYSVTLVVDDGDGGQAWAFVTISVTDVDEPPQRPGAPAVTAVSGTTTSLQASWNAPANAGRPPITSYDMQYRKQGATNWTDGPQDVAGTSTQIDGLDAGTVYEVQVRASNDEGDGPYSPPGTASTGTGAGDNDAPVFVSSMVTLTLPENTGGGVDVGSPVEATDADGDSLTYSLGGVDASSFTIDETSSQIRTRRA